MSRSTPVAIRASNVAFRDLELHCRPGTLTDKSGDRRSLQRRISMIELENDWIAFIAVNAGMTEKVVEELLTTVFAIEFPTRTRSLQVGR